MHIKKPAQGWSIFVREKNSHKEKNIVSILSAGGVGVLPTDTLYGLVGSALKKATVERIYKLLKRDLKKPMIILIPSFNDLEMFGVRLSRQQKIILGNFWPGKVSVVLDAPLKKCPHLHRGGKTLAFRFPKKGQLIKILKRTGPLVAPSANIAGKKPAENRKEAQKYFGNGVDFYADSGKLSSKPSTLVKLDKEGNITVLRPGAVRIKS